MDTLDAQDLMKERVFCRLGSDQSLAEIPRFIPLNQRNDPMSIEILPATHIDAMIRTALHGPSGPGSKSWVPMVDPRTGLPINRGIANELGAMLHRENVASYCSHLGMDLDAGIPVQYSSPFSSSQLMPRLSAIAGYKAVECYATESSHHRGWDSSQANAFCFQLAKRLIPHLPGCDEADARIFPQHLSAQRLFSHIAGYQHAEWRIGA